MLSAIGISLSIALGICIFSLSAGIDTSIHNILEESGVDIYVVPKGVPVFFQDAFPPMSDGREISRTLVEHEGISAAGPRLIDSLYLTSMTKSEIESGLVTNKEGNPMIYHAIARGRIPDMDGDFGGESILSGSYLPTSDDPFYQNGSYEGGLGSDHFTHEIVLDRGLAKILKVNAGDRIYAAGDFPQQPEEIREWWNGTAHFNVVGVVQENYETEDMLSCVLHLSELQYLLGMVKFDSITKVFVQIEEGADPDTVRGWIEEGSPYHDRLSAHTKEEYERDLIGFSEVMKSFGESIAIITTVVSVIFVTTVVVISVKERTREIGILKAIGISNRSIVGMFIAETLVLCFVGYILGLIFGYIGTHIVDFMVFRYYDSIPASVQITTITPYVIGKVTVYAFVISVLGSLFPSYFTARVRPVTAMRRI